MCRRSCLSIDCRIYLSTTFYQKGESPGCCSPVTSRTSRGFQVIVLYLLISDSAGSIFLFYKPHVIDKIPTLSNPLSRPSNSQKTSNLLLCRERKLSILLCHEQMLSILTTQLSFYRFFDLFSADRFSRRT